MKQLTTEFVSNTLKKIETALNCVLKSHGVEMAYDLEKRNQIFAEVIKKGKSDLMTEEMYEKIQNALHTNTDLTTEESEWLSQQIFEFNKDIFLLHYFYAIIYTYNYDAEIQQKITEEHIQGFFDKANVIYKKYKNLTLP